MLNEIALSQKQLIQSQHKYQNLFDEALSANYICTPEGELILCNPTFLDMLGYKYVEEVLHTNARELLTDTANKDTLLNQLKNKNL